MAVFTLPGQRWELQQRPSGLESLNSFDKHFLYARDGNMDCFIIVIDSIYDFGTIFIPIL